MNIHNTASDKRDTQTKAEQQAEEKNDMHSMNAFMERAGTLADDPFFGGL